jgi:cell division protein FtsB
MQATPRRRRQLVPRAANASPYVTAAVGLGESSALGLRRSRPGRLFTRTLVWVTALICLSLLLGSVAQAWSNSRLMQDLAAARADYQQTLARHQALQKLIAYYKDPFVIESEARQDLGYVRPGEHRVIIVSAPGSSPPSRPRPAAPSSGGGFWSAWWSFLFGS